MELWRTAWREIAQRLSMAGLQRLAEAIRTDSPELVQGKTACVRIDDDDACLAACAIAYCGWKDGGFQSPQSANSYLANMTFGVLHQREFLDWYDNSPRLEMRRELLPEVERELARRQPSSRSLPDDR